MDVGTLYVTYSVVPEATVTFVAVVVPEGPPPEVVGLSVTVTLAGGIVPLGKPCPITVTLVTPGSAALGEVNPFSVTFVTAPNRSEPESKANARCICGVGIAGRRRPPARYSWTRGIPSAQPARPARPLGSMARSYENKRSQRSARAMYHS